jgi:zinc protease
MTQRRRLTNRELLFSRWQLWKILLGGILTVLGGAGTVLATAEKGIQEHTLANGLQVVLGEDHWHPLAALAVCYRVGSRNDPAGKQGLAHLLEHLTFRSLGLPHAAEATPTAGPGRAGATTIHDTTCYSSRLLRTELEHALAVEAARMATLQISADDLEHEKAIVIKERRQLVEGDTWHNFLEEIDSIAFRLHPYRFPTTGWPETLVQISLDDVQKHFAAYYAPGNAVLVVVGDFHTQDLLARIESTFGQIPARALPAPSVYVEPASGGERRVLLAPRGAPRIAYAYHVPAFGSSENAALEVLATLLADGDQARLSAFLYGHHLAEAVGIEYSPLNRDPGLFYIKVVLGSPANFRLTGQAVDDVLWHLREDGLQPGELEQTKKRLLLDFYLDQSLETQAERLGQYGTLAVVPQAAYSPDDLRAVTAADVQHAVRAYFLPENRVVGITGVAHQEEKRPHKEGEAR